MHRRAEYFYIMEKKIECFKLYHAYTDDITHTPSTDLADLGSQVQGHKVKLLISVERAAQIEYKGKLWNLYLVHVKENKRMTKR